MWTYLTVFSRLKNKEVYEHFEVKSIPFQETFLDQSVWHMQMSEFMMSSPSLLAIYFVHKILKILIFAPTFDSYVPTYQDILVGNIILHLFRE